MDIYLKYRLQISDHFVFDHAPFSHAFAVPDIIRMCDTWPCISCRTHLLQQKHVYIYLKYVRELYLNMLIFS